MVERKLRIFICHASQDKPIVRELFQRLFDESWIDPWLDEENLLPGQDWDMEIEKAVEAADVVIVCVSNRSVTKEGYVQRELKFVLDIALEKPDGTIFVIPLRLDDCIVPRRLRSWQYVDYFPLEHRQRAYHRLVQSLRTRHSQLEFPTQEGQTAQTFEEPTPVTVAAEAKVLSIQNTPDQPTISLPATMPGNLYLVATIVPILFFAQLALSMFGQYDGISWVLLGLTAIVMAFFLLFRRQVITNPWIKLVTILFLVIHSLVIYGEFSGWGVTNSMIVLDGVVALTTTGLLIFNFKAPHTSAPYAAVSYAAFLLLYAAKLLLSASNQNPDGIQAPMVAVAMIGCIFLWLER